MAYVQPYIDETGLHIPTYSDIRDDLVATAKLIFGEDVYLDEDSQDYQYISAFASKINDVNLVLLGVYNNKSPAFAIGAALDSIIRLNGMVRLPATYSQASVFLEGIAGQLITNGVIEDIRGIKWDLPVSVTLDINGESNVIATCQEEGPIVAAIGEITIINTPTYGWNSVTNTVAATLGSYTETDAELRARQAVVTARPSLSILEGTIGEIASVVGVTRYKVYENDTDATDSNGIPSHSIAAVVEGGDDESVAQAIFDKKGIGCGTYGSTTESLTDEYGTVTDIAFSRPDYIDIDVEITVKAISGYTSETTDSIKEYIYDYLNSLEIGADVPVSSLWGVALQANASLKSPNFSITSLTQAEHLGVQGAADVVVDFDEVARGTLSYITITVT